MGYFWDINLRACHFHACKNSRKVYKFDDSAEFGDDAAEAHVDDEQHMRVPHDVPKGDGAFQDAPHVDAHRSNFGTGFYGVDTSSIMTMLQNMQLRHDERCVEDCQRRDAFEAAQMERFFLMQEHVNTQDANFETFSSYVTETLVPMQNDMDTNHAATTTRINHMIASKNENHHQYMRFYREMCEFLDYQYGNVGQG